LLENAIGAPLQATGDIETSAPGGIPPLQLHLIRWLRQ
jgi:hypothetical protein